QSPMLVATPPPAVLGPFSSIAKLIQARPRDSRRSSTAPVLATASPGNKLPMPANATRMMSNHEMGSHGPATPATSDVHRASKQFTTSLEPQPANKHRSTTSRQSAAAHIAVRQGDVLQTICYGPVQFADISE